MAVLACTVHVARLTPPRDSTACKAAAGPRGRMRSASERLFCLRLYYGVVLAGVGSLGTHAVMPPASQRLATGVHSKNFRLAYNDWLAIRWLNAVMFCLVLADGGR